VERKKREVWNGKIGGEMSKKQQLRLRFEGPTKFFSLIFSFLFLTLRLRLELDGDRTLPSRPFSTIFLLWIILTMYI
jgi:hypothetical protein